MTLTLAQLLGGERAKGSVEIAGLSVDSRVVQKGDLFVALPGASFDGRSYIEDAIKAGASAVLTTPGVTVSDAEFPVVEDANPRRRYAELAARFYGKQPEVQVAVTGTNGKTSVADFTRQIWMAGGKEAASIGTLGVRSARYDLPGGLTTPDPMGLHRALNALAECSVTHSALEASSHGLDQYRLDGVRMQAAGFTNLTRDHLDYHKNEQAYFYAKARLFGELLSPGDAAVINTDSSWGAVLDDIAWGRGLEKVTTGQSEDACIQLLGHEVLATGQRLTIGYCGQNFVVELPLIGAFQAENALVSAGLAIATGSEADQVFEALSALVGVPGRMEFMGKSSKGGAVFVDYAHTPNGLATVLKAARAHNPSKLHVVFGCGGDRDKGKRPQMGQIASDLADSVYVTDDNPRTENARAIRSEILSATKGSMEVADRAQAIERAIFNLNDGDILVVAGKGHEEGQVIGSETLPYSDIDTVKTLLAGGA